MVSTHLKNISQNGNLPQGGVKTKKYLKPPRENFSVPLTSPKVPSIKYLNPYPSKVPESSPESCNARKIKHKWTNSYFFILFHKTNDKEPKTIKTICCAFSISTFSIIDTCFSRRTCRKLSSTFWIWGLAAELPQFQRSS